MGGGGRRVELFEKAVEGRLSASHGANVSFSLPLRCPLDAAELERHRVSGRCRSTVRACPYGHGHDRHGVGGVRKAMCMYATSGSCVRTGREGGRRFGRRRPVGRSGRGWRRRQCRVLDHRRCLGCPRIECGSQQRAAFGLRGRGRFREPIEQGIHVWSQRFGCACVLRPPPC